MNSTGAVMPVWVAQLTPYGLSTFPSKSPMTFTAATLGLGPMVLHAAMANIPLKNTSC
jgi:hypothetical protein